MRRPHYVFLSNTGWQENAMKEKLILSELEQSFSQLLSDLQVSVVDQA